MSKLKAILCHLRLTILTGGKGCKTSEVSSLEQVQTSSTIYNTERRISSEDFNNLYDRIRNLQSKGSDIGSSCGKVK